MPAFRASALLAALFVSSAVHAADVTVKLGAGDGFEITDNAGAIDRLRVDEATGNVSRNGALFVHTTGTSNTFVGAGAGNTGTSGPGHNTGLGRAALQSIGPGAFNTAVGAYALGANTSGYSNSAVGMSALRLNSTGSDNSAFGAYALRGNTSGSENSAFGRWALSGNSMGGRNSALGFMALQQNGSGYSNAAFGWNAMHKNLTASQNSAFGNMALYENQTGAFNSAFGSYALASSTAGARNSAFGKNALFATTTGSDNAAFGFSALQNTIGARNVAVGRYAGINQTTGNDNIYLANQGVAGESGQIKIGTAGTHTGTTIAGISGATSSGGIAVLVNASGKLGTTTSSARFKQNVRDMDHASDFVMKLRPVAFEYLEEAVGAEESKETQYGLIAEEVAEVAPELIAPDAEGRPWSVKYHELPALLLNELQKQERVIAEQRAVIAKLSERIERLEAR
ncbi:MAG TPA: tail fiber domain-containing protein [Myxococcota bacterium]|nr:tail fiber domain-containing protein [Myxococcota bacterium]